MGQKKISTSITDDLDRERDQAEIGRLRQLLQAGIDSEPGRHGSINAIKKAAHARH